MVIDDTAMSGSMGKLKLSTAYYTNIKILLFIIIYFKLNTTQILKINATPVV